MLLETALPATVVCVSPEHLDRCTTGPNAWKYLSKKQWLFYRCQMPTDEVRTTENHCSMLHHHPPNYRRRHRWSEKYRSGFRRSRDDSENTHECEDGYPVWIPIYPDHIPRRIPDRIFECDGMGSRSVQKDNIQRSRNCEQSSLCIDMRLERMCTQCTVDRRVELQDEWFRTSETVLSLNIASTIRSVSNRSWDSKGICIWDDNLQFQKSGNALALVKGQNHWADRPRHIGSPERMLASLMGTNSWRIQMESREVHDRPV